MILLLNNILQGVCNKRYLFVDFFIQLNYVLIGKKSKIQQKNFSSDQICTMAAGK